MATTLAATRTRIADPPGDRARGEDMVGEAARVGVLLADPSPVLVHQKPVEDVGRFVDGGRDGLDRERGESVGDVRVRREPARPRAPPRCASSVSGR